MQAFDIAGGYDENMSCCSDWARGQNRVSLIEAVPILRSNVSASIAGAARSRGTECRIAGMGHRAIADADLHEFVRRPNDHVVADRAIRRDLQISDT